MTENESPGTAGTVQVVVVVIATLLPIANKSPKDKPPPSWCNKGGCDDNQEAFL
jgi:hypothetical protein